VRCVATGATVLLKRGYRRLQEFFLPLTGGIPPTSVEAILNNATRLNVELADWARDIGAGSMWDLLAVCLIARYFSPRICFEIGTGHGRTTHHLALNTPPDARIYTLDVSTEPVVGSIFRDQPTGAKILQLTADSASFDFGPWARCVDLVSIDGDHGYKAVSRDTERALEMLAPGGCIIWDDFVPDWPGVIRALKRHPRRKEFRRVRGTKLVYYRCL